MYPTSWDNTAITFVNTSIEYDGIEVDSSNSINVRMVFKNNRKTTEGHIIEGNGTFYKYGELTVNKGDNFSYDSIEYTVKEVYYAKNCDGSIEYTRVRF